MMVRSALVGGAVIAATLGLAAPASAAPLNGPYLSTVTDGGGVLDVGDTMTMLMSSCGPDCTSVASGGWTAEVRLQGSTWSGTTSKGLGLTWDDVTLAGSMTKGSEVVLMQLSPA